MEKKLLHIIHGDALNGQFQQMDLHGEVVIWREMLCEGPTMEEIGSAEFINLRKDFFREKYEIFETEYQENFLDELEKLATINNYDEIVLWFEFDLFSHMNMLAVINFLLQNKKETPLFLVCSGRVKGEKKLLPLAELSLKQLQQHYDNKIRLTKDDLEMASLIWSLYCGKNPMKLISEIKKTTNFQYLPSCLRAHIERFPHAISGLNTLELNVLKLIESHKITSSNQLLGYALEYQGYYGYDDMQMQRVIDKLNLFYSNNEERISLNEAGTKALKATKNFYQELKEKEYYGGVEKYDFLYEPNTHKLLKL